MNDALNKAAKAEDEVDLRDVLSTAWRGKWIIVLISLACAAVGFAAAIVVPKSYTASAIVAPASNNVAGGASGGLSSLASQFGGLASLAGVSVPGESKKYESIAVLQSEAITEKYIQDNNLLPIIFQERWDSKQNRWKNSNGKKIPTLWWGNDRFKKDIRAVSTDTKTGLVTLSISWRDPKVAAAWANDLIKLTNEYLRAKAIREAEVNMAYLNEQALKTDVVSLKQGIYTMLQAELNKVMMAKGTDEFALKIIDPAVAPERPSSPHPIAWPLYGLFGGLVLSTLIVFYRAER
jgi:uncharacterized protein involved in exopolysaccharide biosynthesis